MARRNGKRWYIAGINAGEEPLKLELDLPMCRKGDKVACYADGKGRSLTVEQKKIKNPARVEMVIQPEGGCILVK